jgi:hypothetical protein
MGDADIDLEQARSSAIEVALLLDRDLTVGHAEWGGLVVDSPLVIYDLNDEPLFYDFELILDGVAVGAVRTAATAAVGSPVVSVEVGPRRWSLESACRLAREVVARDHPSHTVHAVRLVCYAYPKIAVRAVHGPAPREYPAQSPIGRPPTPTATLLIDVGDGRVVDPAPASDVEHHLASYSYLEQHPVPLEERRASYARASASAPVRFGLTQRPSLVSGGRAENVPEAGVVWLSPLWRNTLGVPHYGQVTPYTCAPTSAQMLLEHYGFSIPQMTVAGAMSASPTAGTTSNGVIDGVQSLADNALLVSFDQGAARSQLLVDAVNELAANRPVFTQIPNHYRLCVGYAGYTGSQPPESASIYIFDPWPPAPEPCAGGAQYWETWATSPVLWFGFVRHR